MQLCRGCEVSLKKGGRHGWRWSLHLLRPLEVGTLVVPMGVELFEDLLFDCGPQDTAPVVWDCFAD